MDLLVVGGTDEESLRILKAALEAARILRRERGVEIRVVPHTDLLSLGGPTYLELGGRRVLVDGDVDRSKILELIEALSTGSRAVAGPASMFTRGGRDPGDPGASAAISQARLQLHIPSGPESPWILGAQL